MSLRSALIGCLAILLAGGAATATQLRVPAFTAYLEPNPTGARVSPEAGITSWSDPSDRIVWFGRFNKQGRVDCSLALRLPLDAESHLRLTLCGSSHEATVRGRGSNTVVVPFGQYNPAPGYQRITLESLNQKGVPAGDLEALLLEGTACPEARFNLEPRRNAASVHLMYPLPELTNVDAFYCEVTAVEDPIWTYYMACGWHRGYFGMQVNSPTERRIIFSVWDSGHEAHDRSKVAGGDRVILVAKGQGVDAGDFGNEGTGGHSHLVYPWKTGERQRFLVTAAVADATHTIFSGYYFHPEKREWLLISSWSAPKEQGGLRGLYSFSENFGAANGQLPRKARFGNQWVHTSDGHWHELLTARFSHDPTGRADRLDRFMGLENGQFFLSHGGFADGYTQFGEAFKRPPVGKPPLDTVRQIPQANGG